MRLCRLMLGTFLLAGAMSSHAGEAEDVSLIRVIVRPENYDGKVIRVIGAFRFRFEEQALYFYAEDRSLGNEQNALWVEIPSHMENTAKDLDGAYVIIEGRFTVSRKGHLGVYPGSIGRISRIERLPTDEELEMGRPTKP